MDLSTLSDEDLLRLHQEARTVPQQPPPDLAAMSDAELRSLHQASAPSRTPQPAPSIAADVGKSALQGLASGAAGLVDLPQSIAGFVNVPAKAAAKYAARALMAPFGGTPASDRGVEIPAPAEPPRLGAAALSGLDALGLSYEPQTAAGRFAKTAAEFVPGAGTTVPRIVGFGVVPGLASEAAGQAAESASPGMQVAARMGAGLLAGVAAGGVGAGIGAVRSRLRPSQQEAMTDAVRGLPEESIEGAIERMRASRVEGSAENVPLTFGEALNRETDGRATRVSQLERVLANSPGGEALTNLYAERPAATTRAAERAFDAVAAPNYAPSGIGLDVQAAARAGLAETPEGQALAAAQAAAGPRVTPMQAGGVMQTELRGVRDRAQQQLDRQAAVDYEAARTAPERFGIDRTVAVERPGEPIVTPYAGPPRFADDAPAPVAPYQAVASAGGRPERGESLARYIARTGGIAPTDDLVAAGLHQFTVPGVGKVVREGGKPLDGYWRQQLRDAGYFRPDADGYATSDITNDLIRYLQNEQRLGAKFAKTPAGTEAGSARQAASAGRDQYDAALSVAESRMASDLRAVGVDPERLHPDLRDRVVGALMRGETDHGADALEAAVRGMREPPPPTVTPTTVRERISAPEFMQVDAAPTLAALDRQIGTAKGDVRAALEGIRRDLYEYGRGPGADQPQLDRSVAGLLHARERLDKTIKDAIRDEDGTKLRDLQTVRAALDQRLKAVPEVAAADRNYALNAQALEPFQGNTPLGRVTQRDDRSGRYGMPAEQVPATVAQPTAAREFADVTTPAGRQALEGRLATQFLDQATPAGGGLPSADTLRGILREHEDLLSTFPMVRQQLTDVALAREGMARVESSPLGRLALQTSDGQTAARVLFPFEPLANSEREIGAAVSALARNNPQAARDLVRLHAEGLFNEAVRETRGLPAQYGGAAFASALAGTPQRMKNLEAAFRALPGGDTAWPGFERFLDVLKTTGFRAQRGSDTAFNTAIQATLKDSSGEVGRALQAAATNAAAGTAVGGPAAGAGAALVALRKSATDAWTRIQVRRNAEGLARLLTDPDALAAMRALSRSPPGSQNEVGFVRQILGLAARAAKSGEQRQNPKA